MIPELDGAGGITIIYQKRSRLKKVKSRSSKITWILSDNTWAPTHFFYSVKI